MNFFANNDTILEKCSISRIQLLELCLGEEGLEGVQCWLLSVLCPRDVCLCVCVYVLFHGAHLFSDAHVDHFFGESPGEREKGQNALTPDGKNYASVNEADASPLTLAFRPNQSPAGEDEPGTGTARLVTAPLKWHSLNSKLL